MSPYTEGNCQNRLHWEDVLVGLVASDCIGEETEVNVLWTNFHKINGFHVLVP